MASLRVANGPANHDFLPSDWPPSLCLIFPSHGPYPLASWTLCTPPRMPPRWKIVPALSPRRLPTDLRVAPAPRIQLHRDTPVAFCGRAGG